MRHGRATEAEVEQRRRQLLAQVVAEGSVRIETLAENLRVSTMTVHRDLDSLESRQLLRKQRGMAVALPNITIETATRFREYSELEAKEAFAEVLVRHVGPGQTVLMDCGSTLFPLARRLAAVEQLTVITNSLRIAGMVGGPESAPGTRVMLLGGVYRGDFEACAGSDTLRQLSRIRADVMFSSATAVQDGRLYHPDQAWADLKEAMQTAARRRVLPVDHSKFGRTATHRYGDVADYDLVVTDAGTPQEEIQAIEARDVPVEIVTV
ncbi:DeoR/GlpR transcriptional regulator [Nocardia terpenica]|uniref:DeoR/GlpR family DNA-binding transcription regulator n=1 Tax=Nocardia terpenica TaxID=455432 RepID=UPI001895D565|nr:DeoR/GlpR family DNA-binding transcription regulator [Nocardia terpenica]MBF6059830.1 DeoR/GlpR transcriptional regulator [Nocardia terpenica]MBF6102629.1 DeoR/GlpR transcriptional regulator [Nocardia terpenica]MBF6111180.1 DeoR/GlpR transcriptional regulator [Nocardia terpenica]MBF6117311.1 DeoR/GlpR transcriptional regulator [Nocardia terpenica]MBF6150848.1 DeoR/GlpR transcriptional regulator [Nocardia terpenica]